MEKTDLSYLVSNVDIMNKFQGQNIKIVTYPELKEYSDIIELVSEEISACFILIKTKQNSGHWTVVARYHDNLYYMDSYGVKPDGELSHISKSLRYELGEDHNYLTSLLEATDMNVTYNDFQFQSYHTDINTCGKWCLVFVKAVFEGLTIKSFKAGIDHLKEIYKEDQPGVKDYIYDRIVSMLYETY